LIKAILWDIDGVIIRHIEYFDEWLKKENYNNPRNIINEFRTTGINNACDEGNLNPLDAIKPFLDRIGWKKTSEEYFKLQYEYEEKYIDIELLKKIQEIRNIGVKCFIASNQNNFRKNHLMQKLEIQKNFDGSYFSCDFNAVKNDDKFWILLKQDIKSKYKNLIFENVLFLDDMDININKAMKYGINGKIINNLKDIEDVFSEIEKNI